MITSLIEEFEYPKLGPGMMWERCHQLIEEKGSSVYFSHLVKKINHSKGRAVSVIAHTPSGEIEFKASHIISSMPLPHLLNSMDPPVPEKVKEAANGLTFRDHITIALVVPAEAGFPDNWIYIHSSDVHVGRIQNFGQWSPHLVKDDKTCLGLEYFVTQGDDLWNSEDADLVAMATNEINQLGLLDPSLVEAAYVVRMPRAYPMYDAHYKNRVNLLRHWLETNASNVYPVGRNGMHRYNNQDHSMVTAMMAIENIFGAEHDIWNVNVEKDYHEEI